MAPTKQWTRIILLAPPAPDGRGLSQSLQSQFAARDWFAIQVNDPYLALAELCLREKSQIARAAWGLQRLEHIGLVVLEPRQWEEAGLALIDLTRAAERHIPAASIWYAAGDQLIPVYQPSATIAQPINQPKIGGVARSVQSSNNGAGVDSRDRAVDLRFAGDPAVRIGSELHNDDAGDQVRISREEIEMLLDPMQSSRSEVAS